MDEFTTPNCDKLSEAREESRIIQEFVEWLAEQNCEICCYDPTYYGGQYLQERRSLQKLLHDYFDIDEDALEKERLKLLEMQRELNKSHDLLDALSRG